MFQSTTHTHTRMQCHMITDQTHGVNTHTPYLLMNERNKKQTTAYETNRSSNGLNPNQSDVIC